MYGRPTQLHRGGQIQNETFQYVGSTKSITQRWSNTK